MDRDWAINIFTDKAPNAFLKIHETLCRVLPKTWHETINILANALQRTYFRTIVATNSSYHLIEKLHIYPCLCKARNLWKRSFLTLFMFFVRIKIQLTLVETGVLSLFGIISQVVRFFWKIADNENSNSLFLSRIYVIEQTDFF